MSMREMDYFDQKPNLDMRAFYEAKGIKLASSSQPVSSAAPPPKDTAWVSEKDPSEAEDDEG